MDYQANALALYELMTSLTPEQVDLDQVISECGTVGCIFGWAAQRGTAGLKFCDIERVSIVKAATRTVGDCFGFFPIGGHYVDEDYLTHCGYRPNHIKQIAHGSTAGIDPGLNRNAARYRMLRVSGLSSEGALDRMKADDVDASNGCGPFDMPEMIANINDEFGGQA